MKSAKDTLGADLKVRIHRVSDIYQLYQYNKNKKDICSINKRMEIWNTAREYGCNVLIETGTYLGEMMEFQRNHFDRLYSIEISDFYYHYSRNRLKKYDNISIIRGNSERELGRLIDNIPESDKIIFWLDGHYSGGNTGKGNQDSPITNELKTIMEKNRNDIILVDDARCFVGRSGYPEMSWIKDFCAINKRRMVCYNDIIHILPLINDNS